jgi:hypothetical protein
LREADDAADVIGDQVLAKFGLLFDARTAQTPLAPTPLNAS